MDKIDRPKAPARHPGKLVLPPSGETDEHLTMLKTADAKVSCVTGMRTGNVNSVLYFAKDLDLCPFRRLVRYGSTTALFTGPE